MSGPPRKRAPAARHPGVKQLRAWYVDQHWSIDSIAVTTGAATSTVRAWLVNGDIPRRRSFGRRSLREEFAPGDTVLHTDTGERAAVVATAGDKLTVDDGGGPRVVFSEEWEWIEASAPPMPRRADDGWEL